MSIVQQMPGGCGENLRKMLEGMTGYEARVGWFENAKYPDGTPVAAAAAVQEFGWAARGIPPRLGLRQLAQERQADWAETAMQAADICLRTGRPAVSIFEIVAQDMAGDVKKRISEVTSPPLAQSTIDARLARMERVSKGAAKRALKRAAKQQEKGEPVTLNKPLVDTRIMFNTVIGKAVRSGS